MSLIFTNTRDEKYLFMDCPKGDDPQIVNAGLAVHHDTKPVGTSTVYKLPRPSKEYSLMGWSWELSEEQAKQIIGGTGTIYYKNYSKDFSAGGFGSICKTAKESLASYLESHGLQRVLILKHQLPTP